MRIFAMRTLAIGLCLAAVPMVMAPADAAAVGSGPIEIDARLSQTYLAERGDRKVFLRIGLRGERPKSSRHRAPLNVALVIDHSGSMQGKRLAEAKRAARLAIDRLGDNDIVSLIGYNSTVAVLVPATRPRDRYKIIEKIDELEAGGSTAIYAGVETAAEEISKFADRERVNRIILLSDGLANVGPRNPSDFARLGSRLSGQGIAVSTIGLGSGYNEDLMSTLARTGEGNHAYVAEPADLATFFDREFDDAVSVIAQDVEIIITFRSGIRPMRSLGRDATIEGNRVIYRVGQLIGGSEQILVSELVIGDGMSGSSLDVANIEVRYRATSTNVAMRTGTEVTVETSADREKIANSYDGIVMKDVTLLTAREQREEAIKLRDKGKLDEARKQFDQNAAYLATAQERYKFDDADAITDELKANQAAAKPAASPSEWTHQRKTLRALESNQAGAKSKY